MALMASALLLRRSTSTSVCCTERSSHSSYPGRRPRARSRNSRRCFGKATTRGKCCCWRCKVSCCSTEDISPWRAAPCGLFRADAVRFAPLRLLLALRAAVGRVRSWLPKVLGVQRAAFPSRASELALPLAAHDQENCMKRCNLGTRELQPDQKRRSAMLMSHRSDTLTLSL